MQDTLVQIPTSIRSSLPKDICNHSDVNMVYPLKKENSKYVMQTNLQWWKSTNLLYRINCNWFNRETSQVMPFSHIKSPRVSGHHPQSQFLCSNRLRALLALWSPWFGVLSNNFWRCRRTFRLLNFLPTFFLWSGLFNLYLFLNL